MRLPILSTFSMIACAFIGFVFASPMDSTSLVARDATSDILIGIITNVGINLTACHTKWKKTCATSCSIPDISGWGNECASIVNEGTANCLAAIPSGWTFPDPTICVSLLANIITEISITLTLLLTECGLLGILISILIILIGGLANLISALTGLLGCLEVTISGLLGLISSLLGGITCIFCGLLGL